MQSMALRGVGDGGVFVLADFVFNPFQGQTPAFLFIIISKIFLNISILYVRLSVSNKYVYVS